MLPEAGAFELVFLAIVALIVVGPKDLPVLLRKVGQFSAKMRGLAGEFRASFDEMARQSELDDLRREVEALRDGRFGDAAKPEIESHLSDIHAGLRFDAPSHPADYSAPSHAAPGDPASAHPPPSTPAEPPVFGAEAEPELPLPPPAAAPAGATRVEPAH